MLKVCLQIVKDLYFLKLIEKTKKNKTQQLSKIFPLIGPLKGPYQGPYVETYVFDPCLLPQAICDPLEKAKAIKRKWQARWMWYAQQKEMAPQVA